MAGNQVDIIIRAVDRGVKKAFTGLAAHVKQSRTALDVFQQSMKKTSATAGIMSSRLAAVFGGIGVGVVTRQLWDAGVAMQRLDLAFTAIAGSAKGGARELDYVRAEADRLGLSFRDAAEGYKAIYAAGEAGGMTLEDTHTVFKGLSEASMALGLSNEQVAGSFRAIGQMMGKQKVLAEEIRTQLGEKMPTAIADFAEAAGVSVGQFEDMMAKGQVGMDTLVKTMELWSTKYGKEAEKAAGMAIGALGRWKTAWFELKVVLANSGFLEEATKNLTRLAKYIRDPEAQKSIKVWSERFWDLSAAIVDATWKYKGWLIGIGGTVAAVSVMSKLVGTVVALHNAFKILVGLNVAAWLSNVAILISNLGIAAFAAAPALTTIAGALASFGVGWGIGTLLNKFDAVKMAGVTMAHGLTVAWLKLKLTWAQLFDEDAVEGIRRQQEIAETTYTKIMDDLRGVKYVGEESYKRVADSAEEGAEREVEARKQATPQMVREYEKYVAEVKKLQQELVAGEQSLKDELRSMRQSGMSDLGAWRDRRKEASEFYSMAKKAAAEAEKAAKSGNHKEAIELAKQSQGYYEKAKDKAKTLNEEVKKGENVVISKAKALKIAYAEAKKYGEAEIAMQQKLIDYTQGAADKINEESGFAFVKKELAEVSAQTEAYGHVIVPALGKAFVATWDNAEKKGKAMIKEIDLKTNELINKKREMTIDIKVNTSKLDNLTFNNQYSSGYSYSEDRLGGLIGRITKMAFGGLFRIANASSGYHFKGYGGGDRPSNMVMAEDGEVMIRKESVRAAGLRAALAFNSGNWSVLLEELMRRFNPAGLMQRQLGGMIGGIASMQPVQMMAAGGVAGSRDLVDVNFNLPGATRPVRASFSRQELSEMVRQMKQFERSSS